MFYSACLAPKDRCKARLTRIHLLLIYRLRDGAEYFFAAPSQTLMEDWLQSLQNNIGTFSFPSRMNGVLSK